MQKISIEISNNMKLSYFAETAPIGSHNAVQGHSRPLVITALHEMQTRSSDENSVCLSVNTRGL